MRFMGCVLGVVCFLSVFTAPAQALILIHEFLADPPAGLAGDANGDGVRSTTQDEFIELYNNGSQNADLSAWYLKDESSVRHLFPNSLILSPNEAYVVFGGGNPQIGGRWSVASSGALSLNNGGDTISLFNASHGLIDQVVYGSEGDKDQSLTRSPEGQGSLFALHTTLPNANGKRFSPGYLINPPAVPSTVAPEPATLMTLMGGCLMGLIFRKRHCGSF